MVYVSSNQEGKLGQFLARKLINHQGSPTEKKVDITSHSNIMGQFRLKLLLGC